MINIHNNFEKEEIRNNMIKSFIYIFIQVFVLLQYNIYKILLDSILIE
jgi:hypothetical protein